MTPQESYAADQVKSPYDKLAGFISAYDRIKQQQIGYGANDQASRATLACASIWPRIIPPARASRCNPATCSRNWRSIPNRPMSTN